MICFRGLLSLGLPYPCCPVSWAILRKHDMVPRPRSAWPTDAEGRPKTNFSHFIPKEVARKAILYQERVLGRYMHPKVCRTIMRVINDKNNCWNGSEVQAYANQTYTKRQEKEIKAWAINDYPDSLWKEMTPGARQRYFSQQRAWRHGVRSVIRQQLGVHEHEAADFTDILNRHFGRKEVPRKKALLLQYPFNVGWKV